MTPNMASSMKTPMSEVGDIGRSRVKGRPGAKPKACRRCHHKKVKCSGGHPCNGCRKASEEPECIYPQAERLVKVTQQYLDDLRYENERLRQQNSPGAPPQDPVQVARHPPTISNDGYDPGDDHRDARHGPALVETPWFVDMQVPYTPILVAEASDSAFATRFRQAMSTDQHAHLPRVDYPSDESIMSLSDAPLPWPDAGKARLLVNVAVRCLGRCYHIVRGSVVSDELDNIIRNPASVGSITKSKFWALFAIGTMYATRTAVGGKTFPGIEYFAKATRVLRLVSERPTVEMVEVWLLLSFYSLCLNRRHSAYSLAGSAVRTAIIMGLHLNVPESSLSDSLVREHRNRVWWTAYTFDRMWAAKLGYPSAIRDEDIKVALPANPVPAGIAVDFPDHAYFVARAGLARMAGRIVHSIYGQRAEGPSLSRRVQDCFREMRQWLDELPTTLHIDPQKEADTDPKARSLQLAFNQLAILATRPILLHVLRKHLESSTSRSSSHHVPASASALSEACVRFARHSCRLLEDSWVNGSFMMFDYFYTQYLFSSGTILAISSLLGGGEHDADGERFQTASDFLKQLRENGSHVAAEFHQHIEVMGELVRATRERVKKTPDSAGSVTVVNDSVIGDEGLQTGSGSGMMTAEMAFSEPVFQDLLEQPLSDLEFIDSSLYLDGFQDFFWPDVYPDDTML